MDVFHESIAHALRINYQNEIAAVLHDTASPQSYCPR